MSEQPTHFSPEHVKNLRKQADFRGYLLEPLQDDSFQLTAGPMRPAVFEGHVRPSRQRTTEDKPRRSPPNAAAGVYGHCGPTMPDYLNQPQRKK